MKLKQVFFTILISAVTAFGVIYGYTEFVKAKNTFAGQEKGVIPSNYKLTKLSDDNTPPAAIDFTQPAAAALPPHSQ